MLNLNTVTDHLNLHTLLKPLYTSLLLLAFFRPFAQPAYTIDKLLFKDDFEKGIDTTIWKTEVAPHPSSSVYAQQGKLILDTRGGVTVWLNKLLDGNILIEYDRTVLKDTGPNDRVSDLNQFWMASDPRNAYLFTRTGVLEEYDSLQLYYAGMGGNTNSTTRFRKYQGNGERTLLQEYKDSAHLLQGNTRYHIKILVKNGSSSFWVNNVLFFTYKDQQPLTNGYFGFRSTKSRQTISNVRVYRVR